MPYPSNLYSIVLPLALLAALTMSHRTLAQQQPLNLDEAVNTAQAMPGYGAAPADNDDAPINTRTLRLDELVAAVLSRNAGLEGLAAAAEAAEYRIEPAGALDDPMLSYAGAPATVGGSRGLQERAELSQNLPWPGKRGLRADEARARARAERQSLQDRRLELAAATKRLFAEWAYIHRTLQIRKAHKELLIELQHVAETGYAAGTAGQQDVLQAQVEEARIETQIIAHQRHKEETRAQINGLLNDPPQRHLPPPEPLPEPAELPDLRVLQTSAIARHPELQRLRARVDAAKARQNLARKDYFPDFKVSAAYNSLWRDRDQRWTLGVSINLPFDFSGKRKASVDAADAETMRYQWEVTDREAQLLARLEQGLAGVRESREIIRIHRERLLPLAEESLDAAVADYRAGRGGFLNIVDAERQQLRAEDNLARAHADYLRELASLERFAGQPLADARISSTDLPAADHGAVLDQE